MFDKNIAKNTSLTSQYNNSALSLERVLLAE